MTKYHVIRSKRFRREQLGGYVQSGTKIVFDGLIHTMIVDSSWDGKPLSKEESC